MPLRAEGGEAARVSPRERAAAGAVGEGRCVEVAREGEEEEEG